MTDAFVINYIDKKILTFNPFETLDTKGVGQLLEISMEKGKKVRISKASGSKLN